MERPHTPTRYVAAVLDAYRHTPGTLGKVRLADRRLAAALHKGGVPLTTVEAALTLAAARRAHRADDAPPLGPIRSLHYVCPVITELLQHPADPAYIEYLKRVLAAHHNSATQDRCSTA